MEYRTDGYVNMVNRFGSTQDSSERYEYQAEPMVPNTSLSSAYETNGLFAKIIDIPAEEAVKHGFDLQLNNPDYEGYLENALDGLDWEEKAAVAIRWARLYGGSIIVMLIDDGRGINEPVDWKNIKSIDELRVYERPIVQPDTMSLYGIHPDDPLYRGSRFGQPEFYQISSMYGTFQVHESRCLVFKNGTLPEYATNSDYLFWGMPEYIRIRRALREVITTHSNGTKLMERMVQAIYKKKDLSGILGTPEGEDEMLTRLQAIDRARHYMNSVAIDSDSEDYDFKTFQLSGVKDIMDSTCNMLSAVTCIPQTILFGRSPAGENSTGASDLENFYNFIERIQRTMLKKNLRTLLDVIFRAGVAQGELDSVPKYKLAFKPLWNLSETEQAAVDQTKAATALTKAQTAQIYADMQALDPSEVRAGLASTDAFNIEELLDNRDVAPLDWGIQDEGIQNTKPRHEGGYYGKIIPNTDGGPGSGRYPKGSGGNIEVDVATCKRYNDRLTKVKTVTGVQVKSISHHAMQRLVERNISEDAAADTMQTATVTYPGKAVNSTAYQKGNIKMVVDNKTGNIITAIVLSD